MWSSNERWDLAGDALVCTVVRQVLNSLEMIKQTVLERRAERNEPGSYFSINPVCFNAGPGLR